MPYQLRRIIAINIRAAKTGLPSQLFAQLDPRGGVLAVGANGVGKTTFLRTIPLFYGATPQQILKGSHKGSMISYTLPHPTSAMVYEYERQVEDDLRCTVMYCRQGEDEPVFHIMRAGFDEKYFLNDQDEFLTREEFKDKAEAEGIKVTPMLRLHQYRAVILNERPMTKEGRELRNLALEFSLAPAPLYNLQQIAAAMTTEKIKFSDLKSIVVDRITEDSGASATREASIHHRQSREDVKAWLDARQHMSAILARKADADRLLGHVRHARKLHGELCTLNVATRSAIDQIRQENERLGRTKEERKNAYEAQLGTLNARIEADGQSADELQQRLEAQKQAVQRDRVAHEHFKAIDILSLVKLAEQEPAIRHELQSLEVQHSELTHAARSAQERATNRLQQVEKTLSAQLSRIGQQESDLLIQKVHRLDALRKDEKSALSKLATPARLQDIASERLRCSSDAGRLQQIAENPTASKETRERLAALQVEVKRLEEGAVQANERVRQAEEAVRRLRDESDEATREHDRRSAIVDDALAELAALQEKMEPEPGTLLAFLRESGIQTCEATARVLDPALLTRKDLAPAEADVPPPGGRVIVGHIEVQANAITVPAWVDMEDLKAEIERQDTRVAAAREQLAAAKKAAVKLADQLREAEAAHATTQATVHLASQALEGSRSTRDQLVEREASERAQAARDAAAERTKVLERDQELEQEDAKIRAALEQQKSDIQKDFEAQRTALDEEVSKRLEEFSDLKTALEREATKQRDQIITDLNTEQAGLGVDSERVNAIEARIGGLNGQIAKLAGHRGDISEWTKFSRDVLPTLDHRDRECTTMKTEWDRLDGALRQLRSDRAAMQAAYEDDIRALDQQRTTNEAAMMRLETLSERLKNFVDYAPAAIDATWNTLNLETRGNSTLQALSTTVSEMQALTRTLRNELMRIDGPPAHWLAQAEKELPDPQTVLEHQNEWGRAETVCRWFDPLEHGSHIVQLNREMQGIYMNAKGVMDTLETFDRNIASFNRKLQKALDETATFDSFGDLAVKVQSAVSKIDFIHTLQKMQSRAGELMGPRGNFMTNERELPSDEDANLMREYRDRLPADGGLRINLRDQIDMVCSLRENNNRHEIRNEDEFQAVSSNGLTTLITTMFLMGFAQMIRGSDSPVHLTWVADEIARIDGDNVGAFLKTLAASRINVICAAPSPDPGLARHFDRLCTFERDGSILTAGAEEARQETMEA